MVPDPTDILVRQIFSSDRTQRLSIYQRADGLFYYLDDIYAEYEEVPPFFWDGYPPSGLFATAFELRETRGLQLGGCV